MEHPDGVARVTASSEPPRNLTIRGGAADFTATVTVGGHVSIEGLGSTVVVPAGAPGAYRVIQDDHSTLVFVAPSGQIRWTFVDGEVFELELGAERGSRGRVRPGQSEALTTPMPATILKLLVAPGDSVRSGDILIILEAMKMEMPVRAPRDGRVAAICCAEGDLVQPGVRLVELD